MLVQIHPTGQVVARYEGDLDPWRVEKDAREHSRSSEEGTETE